MGTTSLADNAYLKTRRGKRRSGERWYVRVPVPPDLQEILRKLTIERSLDTTDKAEARKLSYTNKFTHHAGRQMPWPPM